MFKLDAYDWPWGGGRWFQLWGVQVLFLKVAWGGLLGVGWGLDLPTALILLGCHNVSGSPSVKGWDTANDWWMTVKGGEGERRWKQKVHGRRQPGWRSCFKIDPFVSSFFFTWWGRKGKRQKVKAEIWHARRWNRINYIVYYRFTATLLQFRFCPWSQFLFLKPSFTSHLVFSVFLSTPLRACHANCPATTSLMCEFSCNTFSHYLLQCNVCIKRVRK